MLPTKFGISFTAKFMNQVTTTITITTAITITIREEQTITTTATTFNNIVIALTIII